MGAGLNSEVLYVLLLFEPQCPGTDEMVQKARHFHPKAANIIFAALLMKLHF